MIRKTLIGSGQSSPNRKTMARNPFRVLGTVVLMCTGYGLIVSTATAQDFKIFSEIYSSESSLPVSQNLTLFTDDLVCDFLLSNDVKPRPLEVVILDKSRKHLVLLDMERRVKIEVSDLQIIKLMDVLTRETLENETSSFLLKDEYEEDSDPDSDEMTFTSSAISYRVKGHFPKNPAILPKYYDFLDNFTKLGATDPRKAPPFPRLKLNSALKRLGWMPTEVHVEISTNDFFKYPIQAHSKHHVVEGLSSKDREMIQAAKSDWVQFRLVDLPEYRRIAGNRGDTAPRITARLTKDETIR